MADPLICGLHHVTLLVSDIDRALRFYRDLLGLPVDTTRPDLGYPGAWLDLCGAQLHLMELPNPDPLTGRPEHGGRDRHLALCISRLALAEERLRGAGLHYTLSRSGRPALFCRDPDQNALELIEENTD